MENHNSSVRTAMDPIDISSSESDFDVWDIDDDIEPEASSARESATFTDSLYLPSQAAPHGAHLIGYGKHLSQQALKRSLPAYLQPSTSSARSANSLENGASNKRSLPPYLQPSTTSARSANYLENGGSNKWSLPPSLQPSTSNARSADSLAKSSARSANSLENGGSNKRSLPAYLQPSTSSARSANSLENVGSHQMHESHADTFYPRVSKPNPGTDYNKDDLGRDSDDEVIMYEKVGNTIVPPAFRSVSTAQYVNSAYEKVGNTTVPPSFRPVSTAQYLNSSDPGYHHGVAEEREGEHDERRVYQAALQDLNQPRVEASLPDGLLSVSLLRHQKIALAWLLQKETASLNCLGGILADDQGLGKTISMIALIQMQRFLESKPKLEDQHNETTEAMNLDDDDDDNKVSPSLNKVKPPREFRATRPAAGTLVVCPASVLRQWARELKEKVANEAKLSVLIYHGSSRTKNPIELASYDVVLTTYAIVANEVPKQPLADRDDDDEKKNGESYGLSPAFSRKQKKATNVSKKRKRGRKGNNDFAIECACGTLAKVGWLRVILDEAQMIKNHKTKVARACCGLRAKRRWCLSGTPIQNAIEELFSYFRFLRYDPYASYQSFCSGIKNPISRDSGQGYKKLQAVLRAIMLRRTKGTLIDGEPIINLPPKTINLDKFDFTSKERAFYDELENNSRSQFKAYAAAGTVNQNYANILLMLLRLRQACGHPLLVKKGLGSNSFARASLETAKRLPRDMLLTLLNLLETSLPICSLCGDPPEEAVISSSCGHIFCYQCVSEYLTGDDNTCPTPKCKEQLAADFLFSKSTLRSCISADDLDDNPPTSSNDDEPLVLQDDYTSTKVKAALEILESHCKSQSPGGHNLVGCNGNSSSSGNSLSDFDFSASVNTTICSDSQTEGPIKAIVFSQWTRMLDLFEVPLNNSRLKYRRLDGTMNLNVRDKAVREFNTDPEVTVMLMSLKAGNLGLNMIAASHVILLDLWWNPTTEDQAVDRAHRIGQTRPVTVTRITIKDTIEDRILALQEQKRNMVASAFGEDHNGGSATRLTVQDLKYLFLF